jgi:ATP-dependent Lon protease
MNDPIIKTIAARFPTFEGEGGFFQEAKKYVLNAFPTTKDKVSFHFVAYQWYNYWKENEFIGEPERTVGKMLSQLVSGFVSLNKKEQLYLKLFPKIEEQFKLIEIKTTEKDSIDKETKSRSEKKITSSYEPLHSLTDLMSEAYGAHVAGIFPDDKFKSRADWAQTQSTIKDGLKTKEGMAPNWTREKGTLSDKTITTKQQPHQQVARLIQCYSLVEFDLVAFLQSFQHFFDNVFTLPGEIKWDYLNGTFHYKTRQQIEAEQPEEKKKKPKPNLWKDLSEEEWKEIHAINEEPHMPTWYLEYLWRTFNRLKENAPKQRGGTAEKTARAMDTIERLIETFYGEIYWSSLENYNQIMSQIVGFKEFKAELRNQIEVAARRKARGKKMLQIFYVLLGKAGVGKSEICQRLAKALKRPIHIINVGGMEHVSELEGKAPSYSAANYGKITEAFVDKTALIKYTIKDLENEVKRIKQRGNKVLTQWEKDRIERLESEIKDWKKANDKRRRHNQPILKEKSKGVCSRAPIILLDEFEKASKQEILDKIGNITDRKLNWTFTDKFLNVRIDLSEALILLTANWLSRVPDFLRDRLKPVNIELLTYQQRIEVLKSMLGEMLAEQDIEDLRDRISEDFLKMCITETWGIRGGINNLVVVMDFLELMEVRGVAQEITDLANFTEYWETEKEGPNGYLNRQEGISKLSFDTSRGKQELILTRRLAQDINPDTHRKETVVDIVRDWPAEYWWGGFRYRGGLS